MNGTDRTSTPPPSPPWLLAFGAFLLVGLLSTRAGATPPPEGVNPPPDPRRYAVYIYQGTEGWAHRWGSVARLASDGEIPIYATGVSGSAPLVEGRQPMRVADELAGVYRFEGPERAGWAPGSSSYETPPGEYPRPLEKFKAIIRLEVSRAEAKQIIGVWEGIAQESRSRFYRFPFQSRFVNLANTIMKVAKRFRLPVPQRATLSAAEVPTTVCWHHGDELYRRGVLPLLEARGLTVVPPAEEMRLARGVPNIGFGPGRTEGTFHAPRALPTSAIGTVSLANHLGQGRTFMGRYLAAPSGIRYWFTKLLRKGT